MQRNCLRRLATLSLLGVMMSGCATTPVEPREPASEPLAVRCNANIQPEAQVHLDLVDRLADAGKPYAALAQLESESLSTPDHWVRKGRLLASTQQLQAAENLFRALAEECDTAEAFHGLGMVLLKSWRTEAGVTQLRIARAEAPSSGNIRNDYGYALLLNGDYEQAAYELRTALELLDGEGPVRQNLAAAYLLTNNDDGLRLLTERYGFGVDEIAHAQRLAGTLRR
ncbi:tetratricopeptide repeat protein [Marinobacter zhejiangensis]|uniref:Flp pilus assembly protein TadD, contains TPR repeats n=1 Tax=Marinobacter zhejiangensis TaxID=488535 RepID=A0A1I4M8U5_9GAMM|nr:hypothetical protein [Marinobacter zhejiangensis]SFL99553.1 Flp pilus assembly protein TadD, contains TPR repeats [Marinobacter zhejiangensis]